MYRYVHTDLKIITLKYDSIFKKIFVKHVYTNIHTYLGTYVRMDIHPFLKFESKSYNGKFLVFYFLYSHVPVRGPGVGNTTYGIVP